MSSSTLHIILIFSVLLVIYKDTQRKPHFTKTIMPDVIETTVPEYQVDHAPDHTSGQQMSIEQHQSVDVGQQVIPESMIRSDEDTQNKIETTAQNPHKTRACEGQGVRITEPDVHLNLTGYCTFITVIGPNATVYVDKVDLIQIIAPDSTVYYRGNNAPKMEIIGPNSYAKRI